MDDLVLLMALLSRATSAALEPGPGEMTRELLADAARTFTAHRRLGGDARKKNPVIDFLYKGA